MEAFSFCWEIIKREGEKFNVSIDATIASQLTAATAKNVNYDVAYNRCSYVYRCGPINLSFAKDCFTKFFSSYKCIDMLLLNWIKNSQTTISFLSNGPAFEYIAFLLSYQEYTKSYYGDQYFPSLSPFKNIKLISKYGAWRNTVNIMDQIITEGYKGLSIPFPIGNFQVIQGDPFVDLTEKLKNPLEESDVVIMMKTLNLQADGFNPDEIIFLIKEFLASLKEDTVIICIDTKPSIDLVTKAMSAFSGTFLFQSIFVSTIIQLEHIDLYRTVYGCSPILSARGSFLVWQKKSLSLPSPSDPNLDRPSESIKCALKINDDSGYCDKVPRINCDSRRSLSDSFYFSTPTSSSQDKEKIFASSESSNFKTDQLFDCSKNTSSQNIVSSSYSQDGYDSFLMGDCDSAAAVSTCFASADKSIQTEPESSYDDVESIKIAALTEKISSLTQSLMSLLDTNEVQDICLLCQSRLKSSKCASINSTSCQCNCKHCSSDALFLNNTCNEGLQNIIEKRVRKQFCPNHLQEQSSLNSTQHNSNMSLIDLETDENCNNSYNAFKTNVEHKSVPKLVIPLNDLSGDVIAQIVSLISDKNS